MIERFVRAWDDGRVRAKAHFSEMTVDEIESLECEDIVQMVAKTICEHRTPDDPQEYVRMDWPHPDLVTEFRVGEYTVDYVYVMGGVRNRLFSKGLSTDAVALYTCNVSYGSCSGCDTMMAIKSMAEDNKDEAVSAIMTLATQIVADIRPLPKGSASDDL